MSLHIASLIPGAAASSSYHTLTIGLVFFFFFFSFIAATLYLLRQWLLPKPIPGIPHNPEATRSLLGDIMAIQNEMPDNISEWVVRQSDRHRSPIYQVFLVPFAKPFVVVSDFREAQDILVRRGREFDRSDLAIALLRGEMPNFHACLKTGPAWAAHRRLLQDIMSPEFLQKVAAPNMYAGACRLLQLWRAKRAVAGTGTPFAANHDLSFATFDAIYDFGYGEGTEERALAEQIRLLAGLTEEERRRLGENAGTGKPVDFPVAPLSPAMEAVLRSTENITKVAVTGFPDAAWRVLSWFPRVRRLRALKDTFIKSQVDMAIKRLDNANPEDGYSKLKCALDLIIQRERTLAEKENREPVYWSDSIKDEMFGFVTAGHETSANVLAWGVKFLADHPDHQASLRAHLRAAHPAAVAEARFPSHDEITSTTVPLLLATIEEILRLSHAAAMTDRQCTEDTVVLGHAVPRGTTPAHPGVAPERDVAEGDPR
ncbi:hypothetical protein PWT90_10750 [Aphanocladium album]|nr:hypothetical protein PWT90_10750 [Aphanocladium album]